MRRSKRLSLMGSAAALTATLAGCVTGSPGGEDEGDGKLNIWYVNILPSYPAWGLSSEIFEEMADELNYTATAVGPPSIDVVAMVGMMDQAIADGADGIIICDADPATMGDAIGRAQAEGIVVVTIGCVDEISDYSIGTDNAVFGATAADIIAEEVGPEAEVGIVSTDQTTPNQVALVDGFRDQMEAEYPDMTIVAWEGAGGDTAVDAQKITSIVAATPTVDAIWCIEGTCPGGAQPGLQEAGKEPGDVFVLGIDDVDTTIAAIEAGWVSASLNQCFFIAPPLAIELIRSKIEGNPVEQRSWSVDVDLITPDRLPYEGCPADAVPAIG